MINLSELLIPLDKYLAAGLHIGTQQKTKDMERYIYRVRADGLYVLTLEKQTTGFNQQQISLQSSILTTYLLYQQDSTGRPQLEKFGKVTGAKTIPGRFIPGTLTNPNYGKFIEPKVVVVTDPESDSQAIIEAKQIGIPVVALCDTENLLGNVDIVLPVNNKGRKAIALVYWLLARQILRERGVIAEDEELDMLPADFELKI